MYNVSWLILFIKQTVKPKCIQTPSTFLTLSQFIRYSLEKSLTQSYTVSEQIQLENVVCLDREVCNLLQSTKNYSDSC